MTTPTEAQEAGHEAAIAYRVSWGLMREQAEDLWADASGNEKSAWGAAERRARMSGPLWAKIQVVKNAYEMADSQAVWDACDHLLREVNRMEQQNAG